jgi:hypothetical protein
MSAASTDEMVSSAQALAVASIDFMAGVFP